MFIRKKRNKSGSITVQVILKENGLYKIIKSFGTSKNSDELKEHLVQARKFILNEKQQLNLFPSRNEEYLINSLSQISNSDVRTIGPELVFGQLYDFIGYNAISSELFRHLVVARLAYPLSKLKTVEYLYRYQGIELNVNVIYRFLDKLSASLKEQVENISFNHISKILNNQIHILFYDMTTLYFEASDEDDLRKTGFSKDGKHSNPQIFLGLLVTLGGYAIGYDIYEGNTYEGKTLIPFIHKISTKYNLNKPIIVADSGLLSQNNIKEIKKIGYEYIIGARLKNENEYIKNEIQKIVKVNGNTHRIPKNQDESLIISYSQKRADKDEFNRKKGLQRLEKRITSGKLTKANINNKGYNKYLKMTGEIEVAIDYDKYESDCKWDGLKGFITNTKLSDNETIDNYSNLWMIEKAFRMSKTDLRIRPIYHRLKNRIEAHICITFTAYSIYKELERALKIAKSNLSLQQAAELTHNMYEISFKLPDSGEKFSTILKMQEKQEELVEIVKKHCWVPQV